MADNQFTPIPLQNYNANPPPDDGTEVPENLVAWDTIKVKLTDPTATIWDSLNANISAAFLKTINTDPDQNNLVQGSVAYGSSALTIANDIITVTRRHHTVATEAAAPTDSIKTIVLDNVTDGAEIILRLDTTGQTITFEVEQGGSGEIFSPDGNNIVLDDTKQSVQFQRRGLAWYQIAYAPKGTISQEFTSAEQTITTGGNVTVAHGLGVVPKIIQAYLVCKIAENNWNIGDLMYIDQTQIYGGTVQSRGHTLSPDATNIYVVWGTSGGANVYEGMNKTTGARIAPTNVNWRLVIKAFA